MILPTFPPFFLSYDKELAIQTDLVFQWIDPRLRFVDSRVTLIQGEDWARDKSIVTLNKYILNVDVTVL